MINPIDELLEGLQSPHTLIVIGKGGVGKTTVSVLLADRLSREGKTLLVSLDPAKHLVEYLGIRGPLKVEEVSANLYAMQVDIGALASKLSNEYADLLRQVTPGLRILGLEDVVKAVRYAPGFEEEIYLRVLRDLYGKEYDYVVVDTPPTGLTHRILTLPGLYVFWLEKLIDLRTKIVSLRYAISRAMGQKIEPRDPVLSKLHKLKEEYEGLNRALRSSDRTSYILVTTPEPLPVYETRSTMEMLDMLKVKPRAIIVNKILPKEIAEELGVARIAEETLKELREIDCGGCLKLGIGYHRRTPRTLDEARELLDMIIKL
ncbi:MAG: ArsA family ATPase [Desulfurococcales archaeon]|nr:ArsA family ATPase [Desulfurococcales archaeon]